VPHDLAHLISFLPYKTLGAKGEENNGALLESTPKKNSEKQRIYCISFRKLVAAQKSVRSNLKMLFLTQMRDGN
jgi:hypothetical protein